MPKTDTPPDDADLLIDLEPLLKGVDVERIVGRSRASIWRDERAGRFPKRVRVGANSVRWIRSEIHAWLAERAAQRTVGSLALKGLLDDE